MYIFMVETMTLSVKICFRLRFTEKGHRLKEALIMRYVSGEMAPSLCSQASSFLPIQPL